jgi:phospholipid-transporting ATPase
MGIFSLILTLPHEDEGALVQAAAQLGFKYNGIKDGYHLVNLGKDSYRYKVLAVNEFDSARKRQSTLIENDEGKFILYIKGADNVIMDRMRAGEDTAVLVEHLSAFAKTGLRTLVLGMREVPKHEAKEWLVSYKEAANSIEDREGRLADVAERLEVDIQIIGGTAIEDRLQEGVPETIATLAQAGIKLWVLTGDKLETAINIGRSANLLTDDMDLIKIQAVESAKITEQLDNLISTFCHVDSPAMLETFYNAVSITLGKELPPKFDLNDLQTQLALVVDGSSLISIFENKKLEMKFLSICRLCKVVIACRVSPKQKADIVKLIRKGVVPEPLTLAIGDGANDVGMIKEAHVGIGISGHEGLQAVNASDYAIAQFRFLQRLLLVHGRWNYRRISKVVLYSFYKNIVLTLTTFYFNFATGFSGTSLYDDIVYSGFNFFLAWPIIGVGIFDIDISEEKCIEQPQVYVSGRMNLNLNARKMLQWILNAFLHSLAVFGLPIICLGKRENSWSEEGLMNDVTLMGITIYTCLIAAMSMKVFIVTSTWTYISLLFFLCLSVLLYIIFLVVYGQMKIFAPIFYLLPHNTISRPTFWLVLILVPVLVFIVDRSIEFGRLQFFPDAIDICIERDHGYVTAQERKEDALKPPSTRFRRPWISSAITKTDILEDNLSKR